MNEYLLLDFAADLGYHMAVSGAETYRVEDTVRARKGALQLAVTNAGTIPDRGLYGVFLATGSAPTAGPDAGHHPAPGPRSSPRLLRAGYGTATAPARPRCGVGGHAEKVNALATAG